MNRPMGDDPDASGFASFAAAHDLRDWEGRNGAYDPDTYAFVVAHVKPDDVVLELGAGDLGLALRLAAVAQPARTVSPPVGG